MTQTELARDYRDVYEYHGNTEVARIRLRGDRILFRDWLFFDSVEEAEAFFNDRG